MKRILILILVFVMTASFPCVSYAMEIEEETAAGSVVDTDLKYGPLSLYIFDNNFKLIKTYDYGVGESYNLSIPVSGYVLYRLNLNIMYYMTAEQKYLLFNSVDTTVTASIGFSLSSDPSFSAVYYEPQFYSAFNGEDIKVISFSGGNLPVKGTYEAGYSDYFYQSDVNEFYFRSFCYFHSDTDRLYDIDFTCTELSLTIRTVGADKSTADIVINLGKIEDSINQGFDNLGNQIGDVQQDINSGFNEVGGKLDSMLTPDSNNQQAVDQMGGQVDSNKQEAEDIKNQIDSLDKPDPDDLIDQIDPDQFIDNDNEAVQEMTGILASVTGSKVVKNYLLLLICIGIVSFVVYGKKGG